MNHLGTRRDFVRACASIGATAAALASLGCTTAVAVRVTPADGRVRLRVADHPALARRGGALRLLPDGGRDELIVLLQDDGTYIVLSSVCTHNGCIVDAEVSRLVCPCHGSTYDRTGRVLRGPAERPLPRYRAALGADGVLEIALRASP